MNTQLAISIIESVEFKDRNKIAPSTKDYIQNLLSESSVRYIKKRINNNSTVVWIILGRLKDLSTKKFNKNTEHPFDIAISTYLLLLLLAQDAGCLEAAKNLLPSDDNLYWSHIIYKTVYKK